MKSSGGFILFFFLLPPDSDLTLILSEFVIFNFLRCVQLLPFEGCLFMFNSLFYSAIWVHWYFLETHLKLFLNGIIHVFWAFTVVPLKTPYASLYKKKVLKYLYEYFKILAVSF